MNTANFVESWNEWDSLTVHRKAYSGILYWVICSNAGQSWKHCRNIPSFSAVLLVSIDFTYNYNAISVKILKENAIYL